MTESDANDSSVRRTHNHHGHMNDEQQIQYKIHKYQLEIYRQSSIKSTKHMVRNDLQTKINRM
jgi:hypothetical protein